MANHRTLPPGRRTHVVQDQAACEARQESIVWAPLLAGLKLLQHCLSMREGTSKKSSLVGFWLFEQMGCQCLVVRCPSH